LTYRKAPPARADSERAGKLDLALKGIKGLDDMCDHLSGRMDAFEGSRKKMTDSEPHR
jgi:hypothetical protein